MQFKTLSEAEKYKEDVDKKLKTNPELTPAMVRGMTFGGLLEWYYEEKSCLLSEGTRGTYWAKIRLLSRLLGHLPLKELKPAVFDKWFTDRLRSGKAKNTVSSDYRFLRAVFEVARLRGILKSDPLRGVKSPPAGMPRAHIPTAEEISGMMEGLGLCDGNGVLKGRVETKRQEAALAFLICRETGMRLGELVKIQWGDLATPEPSTRKIKKRHSYLITSYSLYLFSLLKHNKKQPFTVKSTTVSQYFGDEKRARGYELNFHDSKHCAVSRFAVDMGFSLAEVMDAVDNNSADLLNVYINVNKEKLLSRANEYDVKFRGIGDILSSGCRVIL